MKKIILSIIIVNYNSTKELINCILSIHNSSVRFPFEIIVVDNDVKSGLNKVLSRKFKDVKYIKSKSNIGYGAGNNLGVEYASGKYILFLNPDTIVSPDAINTLVNYLEKDKRTAIAAPLLLDAKRNPYLLQGTSELTPIKSIFSLSILNRIFPNNSIHRKYWLLDKRDKDKKEVDVVPGTAFVIRKKIFEEVKGFDENFFLFFEESDLCKRVRALHYKLYILKNAKVVHFWGKSTDRKSDIHQIFKKSRFYYFKKHYGFLSALLVESFSTISKNFIIMLFVLLLGVFLRLYKINTLMMFIGDHGWFYFSALDILIRGKIPLVGIPSSVVWLHQGPLATYLMALALWIGNFRPWAPAVFFALLDEFTIYLLFFLGRKLSSEKAGIIGSFLYATSPLIVVNARMPYHTTSIPFFTTLWILLFFYVLQGRKRLLPLLLFVFGLLFQLELSNGILVLILIVLLSFYRKKFCLKRRDILQSIIGLILGILPFILYDFSHRFTQTFGYLLWVINRARLFVGLSFGGAPTVQNFPHVSSVIWEQISRILFPSSQLVVIVLFLAFVVYMFFQLVRMRSRAVDSFRKPSVVLISLWVIIPLLGFVVHSAPGDAYFPIIFPAICLLIGIPFVSYAKKSKIIYIVIIAVGLFNSFYIISNQYFLITVNGEHALPPGPYRFGEDLAIRGKIADYIAKDSKGRQVAIRGGGYISKMSTGVDNYKYLAWWKGAKLSSNASLTYVIYHNKSDIPKRENPSFRYLHIYVVKYEK